MGGGYISGTWGWGLVEYWLRWELHWKTDRPGKKGRKMESKGVMIEQRKRHKTMRKAQRKRWRARKKAAREMGERTVLKEQGKLLVTVRKKMLREQTTMEGRTARKEEKEGQMDVCVEREKGEKETQEKEDRGNKCETRNSQKS